MQEYFTQTFFIFIYHICLHKSGWSYSINLIFGEVAQHQSQCSIFANQQLKVANIFLCSCCFRPTATWLSFHCWPTLINPVKIAFTEQSFQPFSGNFATIFRYPKPSFRNVSIRALSSYDILPITKVIGLITAIMTWNEQYDNLHFPVTYSVSPPLCIALQRTFVSTYKLYSHKSAAIVNILPT